jgi:hypothetical protein
MKYGWMVELEPLTVREWYRWHGTTIVLSKSKALLFSSPPLLLLLFHFVLIPSFFAGISIYIVIAFILEKAASKKLVTDRVVSLLQTLNITSLVVISSAAVLYYRPPAAAGVIAMLTMTISMMKLISYVQVNKHLRQDSRKPVSTSKTGNVSPTSLTSSLLPASLLLLSLLFFFFLFTDFFSF